MNSLDIVKNNYYYLMQVEEPLRTKASEQISYEELFSQICLRKEKSVFNPIIGIVPLKTANSRSELKVPVINDRCRSISCLWSLEELKDVLQIEVQGQTKKFYYFCPNCYKKEDPQANKRYIDQLSLNKQLMLYITQAKEFYTFENPNDKNQKLFKNGNLNFEKNGTIQYTFDMKQGTGKVMKNKLLKDPFKADTKEYGRFNEDTYKKGTDSVNVFMNNKLNETAEKLSTMSSFFQIIGNSKPDLQNLCPKLSAAIKQNMSSFDYKQRRESEFTFVLFSPNTLQQKMLTKLNFLVAYYPHFNLWKKYNLVYKNGQPFDEIQSAVYLKDPSGRLIYIIGGCTIKQSLNQTLKFPAMKKEINNFNTCYALDLSKANIFEPKFEVEMKVKNPSPTKIQSTASIDSPPGKSKIKLVMKKPTICTYIGQHYRSNIEAVQMDSLPEQIASSAGIIYNNYIYIFGGSRVKNQVEEALSCAYRIKIDYNLKSKWQKLNPLPTPRRGHNVIAWEGRLLIFGGSTVEKGTISKPIKSVDIFNPESGKYETKEINPSPYTDALQGELFGNRCIACQISDNQFLMLNGDKTPAYIFNPQNMTYAYAGPQPPFPSQLNFMKGGAEREPKMQQIYDRFPPKYNGYYYYIQKNLDDKRIKVIYLDREEWHQIEEYDPQKFHKSMMK